MDTIRAVWDGMQPLHGQLISFAFSVVLLLVGYLLRRRPDLRWGLLSSVSNNHELDDGGILRITSASHLVQNVGGAPAKDVQVVFNYKPNSISVWPQQAYVGEENPESRWLIRIPSIGPHENVTINSIMIGVDHPNILTVKTPEGLGKFADFSFHRDLGKFRNGLILALMFLGFVFFVNLLLSLAVGWPG